MKTKLSSLIISLFFSSTLQAQLQPVNQLNETYTLPVPVKVEISGIQDADCSTDEMSCQTGASLVVLAPIRDRVQLIGEFQHEYDSRSASLELTMQYDLNKNMSFDVRFNNSDRTTAAGFSAFF